MAPSPDVKLILESAERLVTVAFRCAMSFGLSDGLNDILLTKPGERLEPWGQVATGLHRDAMLMAALRTSILLDSNERHVSFQSAHHRLKKPEIEKGLLIALEELRGPDVLSPSRVELIEQFRNIYREIDWKVHGRLVHFRDLGIAHLSRDAMLKSVTWDELRTMVSIVTRLADTVATLCGLPFPALSFVADDYRNDAAAMIRKVMQM